MSEPSWQLLRLMDGFVVTQLLYVAAAGLLDALRDDSVPFERVYGERFFDRPAHEGLSPFM